MKFNAKVGIATAVSALAIAGPTAAQALANGPHGAGTNQQAPSKVHGNQGNNQGKSDQGKSDHGKSGLAGTRGHRWGHFVAGTLVSWTATQSGKKTYSGSITLTTTDPGVSTTGTSTTGMSTTGTSTTGTSTTGTSPTPTTVTYTFTNAKVFFGHGANPPAAGDVVKVMGFDLRGHGHGHSTSTTSTPTVRAIFIRLPHTSSSH